MNRLTLLLMLVLAAPGAMAEILSPASQTVNLGKVTSGNLQSLAADDNNAETLCKFVVPNQSAPFVRLTLGFVTATASPASVELVFKAEMATQGVFKVRGYVHDYATSSEVLVVPDATINTTWATYAGQAPGSPDDYVGSAGAMQYVLEVQQGGPSANLTPCVNFEYVNVGLTAKGSGLANSPWPKFQRDAANSGCAGGQGAKGQLKRARKTGKSLDAAFAIGADGAVYVGSDNGNLYALDGATGAKKWSFLTGSGIACSPAISTDGTVYVNGNFYALDGATGALKWSQNLGIQIVPSPLIGQDGTIYVAEWLFGWIYALDGATGTTKWRKLYHVYRAPAVGADGTLYVGTIDGTMAAVNPINGAKVWETKLGSTIVQTPAIGDDGTVYASTSDTKSVVALDGVTGARKWATQVGGMPMSAPSLGLGGRLYAGCQDGKVYALDRSTGVVLWTYLTGSMVEGTPAVGSDGTVYVGSDDGKLYAFDGATGSLEWSYPIPAVVSAPAIGADGTVYVGSTDGNVYAFG